MTILISDNGEFSKGLKFEARGSAHSLSHGPVYGSAGYLALRLDANAVDTGVYLLSSTDGNNWVANSHNINLTSSQISGITYVNNRYVVYGIQNNNFTSYNIRINTSTDGITWTSYTSAALGIRTIGAVNYSNSLWQVYGTNGNNIVSFTSSNLTTWTERINSIPSDGTTYSWLSAAVTDVATDGTNTVVIGAFGSYRDADGGFTGNEAMYFQSTNGTTFTSSSLVGGISGTNPDGWTPYGIAYSGFYWIVVGTLGKIYTSTNRTTWTARTSGTTQTLYSIAYANSKYVAYGDGVILTSSDAITWTTITPPTISSDDILYYSNGAPNETKPVYANSKWIVGNYTSSDAATWNILDYQIPNKQPFIKYPYESGWNTWKTMDFHVYIPNAAGVFTHYAIASKLDRANNSTWSIYLEQQGSGALSLRMAWTGQLRYAFNITSSFNYADWNHIRIVSNGTTGAVYLNGTRLGSTITVPTVWSVGEDTLNIGISSWVAENQRSRPVDYFLDEFLLTDEILNSPTATTITVPTQPWVNNEYTSILLHFNTNFEDDPSTPTRNTSLNVNATFTEVAAAVKNVKTIAALSSTSNQTVVATKAVNSSASLTSTSTITASITRSKQFAASLTTSASNLTANARSRGFGAILTSTVSVNAVITKSVGVITSSLASTSSLAASFIKVKQFTANLTSSGSTLIANVRGRTNNIQLVVTSTLTANAVISRLVAGTLTTNSSLSAQPNRIKQFNASLNVGAIELVVNQKTTRLVAALTSTSTLAVSAVRTRKASASLNCQASVTAVGIQSRIMRANLSATSSLFATTGNVKRAVANLNAGAFQVTTGRAINLVSTDIWIIPSDNRFWIIQNDNRLWTIAEEDRAYTIKG